MARGNHTTPSNKIKYESGDKIGFCIYLRELESIEWKRMAIFLCRCGKEFEANITKVKSGHTKSC